MTVSVFFKKGIPWDDWKNEQVEHISASTTQFPYWVFWLPVDSDNQQQVEFLADDQISRVTVSDTVEEEGAKLYSIPGGENDRPIP